MEAAYESFFFRRTLSLFLSASLACSLGISAAASNALGEDLFPGHAAQPGDAAFHQRVLELRILRSADGNVVTYTPMKM